MELGAYSLLIIGAKRPEQEYIAKSISALCPRVKVYAVSCGHAAFFYLKKHSPSAIIIDFILPDIKGLDFIGIIKRSKRLKHTPVLVMSAAYTEPADRAAAFFSGASDFVQKPIWSDKRACKEWILSLCRELAYQLKISYDLLSAAPKT